MPPVGTACYRVHDCHKMVYLLQVPIVKYFSTSQATSCSFCSKNITMCLFDLNTWKAYISYEQKFCCWWNLQQLLPCWKWVCLTNINKQVFSTVRKAVNKDYINRQSYRLHSMGQILQSVKTCFFQGRENNRRWEFGQRMQFNMYVFTLFMQTNVLEGRSVRCMTIMSNCDINYLFFICLVEI